MKPRPTFGVLLSDLITTADNFEEAMTQFKIIHKIQSDDSFYLVRDVNTKNSQTLEG